MNLRTTLTVLLAAGLLVSFVPTPASAAILTPFGGRVLSWNPAPPGCYPIQAAIIVATLGSISPTVEQIVVGPPRKATLGLLRINGLTIPGLTTIHNNGGYEIPGGAVTGMSINLCDVCGKFNKVPGVKALCKLKPLGDILSTMCEAVGGASCPINNLIYSIGSAR